MGKDRRTRRHSEQGIALLIAIFVLLLISVVAIALLVSSGTEAALGANYRASSTVYYAAMAGLEEARGRLLPKNPNYFGPGVISPTTVLPSGQSLYLINRLSGETIAPCDSSNPYFDKEYQTEFGVPASSATCLPPVNSVWDNNIQTIPGPAYKWVRINAATEQSLFIDVDYDHSIDSVMLFYNSSAVDSHGNSAPSLSVTPTTSQALEITSMASLPNGTQKILQYVVAPISTNLSFPAAITLAGNNVMFSGPSSASFTVDGNDQAATGICAPGAGSPAVAAIGYTNNGDASLANIDPHAGPSPSPGIPSAATGHYAGAGSPPYPSVGYVGPLLNTNLQSVSGLNALVQTLTQNADVVLPGGLMQSDSHNQFPTWMSASNPATIVVNGDITFNGWHSTGYGLLLVTGQLTYDPDASWEGIILVIGKGVLYTHQSGVGQFQGAVFLATTVDASGNPLPPSSALGSPFFNFTSGAGGTGVTYSSCAVQWAQSPLTYKVLSFHEIGQ